jgi:hypothetical protein
MADDVIRADDDIQHGIDDNPNDDAKKGAALGGLGGAAVGAAAGSMMGPGGAVIGGIVGAVAGAAASGAAVAAVDDIDNDDNVTGLGDNVAYENDADIDDDTYTGATTYDTAANTTLGGTSIGASRSWDTAGTGLGNDVPGVQTGGYNVDGTPDTRGITEKAADAITGDRIDDKTGKPVAGSAYDASTRWDNRTGTGLGNDVPGVQTGGYAADGTPDTRGVSEKAADAITGDRIDDKTGKVVP